MKRYQRCITYDEAKAASATAGYQFDDEKHIKNGSDYVRVVGQFGDKQAAVLYSPWNGKFFGATTDGIQFSSDNTIHDGQPWFDAMLDFFNVGPVEAEQ